MTSKFFLIVICAALFALAFVASPAAMAKGHKKARANVNVAACVDVGGPRGQVHVCADNGSRPRGGPVAVPTAGPTQFVQTSRGVMEMMNWEADAFYASGKMPAPNRYHGQLMSVRCYTWHRTGR